MPRFRLRARLGFPVTAEGVPFDAHTPLELFAGLMEQADEFLPGERLELEILGWTEGWSDDAGGYVPTGPGWLDVGPSPLSPLPADPDALEQAVVEAWPGLLEAAWPLENDPAADWSDIPF